MGSKIKVEPIEGWFLICPVEGEDGNPIRDEWYIAWLDPFSTRRRALEFAARNSWWKPYRALRGQIAVREKTSH